jgi:hypothetical protein
LNKVNRKISLDKSVAHWNDKENNIIDWWKILESIDDPKLNKLCGTDIALYLIWLRYAANFFGIISIMNIGFLILYMSGEPSDQDNYKKNEQSIL